MDNNIDEEKKEDSSSLPVKKSSVNNILNVIRQRILELRIRINNSFNRTSKEDRDILWRTYEYIEDNEKFYHDSSREEQINQDEAWLEYPTHPQLIVDDIIEQAARQITTNRGRETIKQIEKVAIEWYRFGSANDLAPKKTMGRQQALELIGKIIDESTNNMVSKKKRMREDESGEIIKPRNSSIRTPHKIDHPQANRDAAEQSEKEQKGAKIDKGRLSGK